jgi:hypothetical protein
MRYRPKSSAHDHQRLAESRARLERAGITIIDETEIKHESITVIPIMPENKAAWMIFCKMDTQWNVGFGGATGINYAALWATIDRFVKKRKQRIDVFDRIGLLERGALQAMTERRK